MAEAKFYKADGTDGGTMALPDHLFACEVNKAVLHQAVVSYLANQRQGNASTKERSDVRGGGRKPFRQKGTGRARAGTTRSPIFRGGGVVFGPHPRDYRKAFPKKMKRAAISSALSARAKDNAIIVVGDLKYEEPKTKRFAELLKGVDASGSKVLFILGDATPAVVKSARNIPNVRVTQARTLNTYDIVWAEKVIMTEGGLKVVEEVFKS
jgi:large subunit ribosomal protein L4